MCGSRGFTLLEMLIAISVIGITFTVGYNLLYKAQSDFEYTHKLLNNFLYLNSKIKQGNTSDLKKTEKELQGYPIKEITYEREGIYLKVYIQKN
ncbi:MAG: prepilin-type N-terminal cleavage/methylation domain-containing protein [Hydrogenothermaceae bacterium]|nr:prepilin-type N-terminal cleavage/methylation domain-containing protein [Hydrogenothermaceae bacterium]